MPLLVGVNKILAYDDSGTCKQFLLLNILMIYFGLQSPFLDE